MAELPELLLPRRRHSLKWQLVLGLVLCIGAVEAIFGYLSYQRRCDELKDTAQRAEVWSMLPTPRPPFLGPEEIRVRAGAYAWNMVGIVIIIVLSASGLVFVLLDRLALVPLRRLIHANRELSAGRDGGIPEDAIPSNELGVLIHERAAMLRAIDTFTAEDVLQALLFAIEAKDNYTRDHCVRVADLARRLASEMGADAQLVEDVDRAARIHDVGKIGIPDAILNKPEPLSPEERAVIERHPHRGMSIIQFHRGLSTNAKLGVLYHHERWDGSGYPYGLKGEEIPLVARILAVADAFDAITQDRPYRKGADFRHALREIQASKGSQFDGVVVDGLDRLLKGRHQD